MERRGKAIFAAGCFWGVEHHFSRIKGVLRTRVGYTGGNRPDPTYREVCSGSTGHAEAVQVEFVPLIVSYEELLRHFFSMHDPTTVDSQGPDFGSQYRSAIFYLDEEQERTAARVKMELTLSHVFTDPIVTELTKASTFYDAEDYHQRYFEKNGMGPCH
ncbi:MAG: peptide-methionine (S)-S-oxide reductase MsrA [Candidatus Thermoplasmatota archaeon]|jgi:methionine-S-sulfoxide reductase|nr:peptide-methionine (S)-S-oxide reductase MsrA [Candidatus Thermoplasmatota archaeon]